MENHHTPTTPESQPTVERTAEQQEALKNLTNIEEFAKVRDQGEALYDDARMDELAEGKNHDEANAAALDTLNAWHTNAIDAYTVKNSLNPADSLALKDLADRYSVANVSKDEWNLPKYDAQGNKVEDSKSEQFAAEAQSLFGETSPSEEQLAIEGQKAIESGETPAEETATPEVPAETLVLPTQGGEETPAESAEATETTETEASQEIVERTRLDDLRDAAAAASAKRQGQFIGKAKNYDEIMDAYNAEIANQAKVDLKETLENGELNDTERNAAVISYILTEQNRLRAASTEKMGNTKLGKFVKFFTTGNKAQRIAKGIIAGAAVGVIGGVIGGAVAGAAGATLVAAGATALFRFGRGFASKDAKEGRGINEISEADGQALVADTLLEHARETGDSNLKASQFEAVQKALNDRLEEDTRNEQVKRTNSAVMGIGAAALGGLIGGFGGQILQDSGALETAGGWIADNAKAAGENITEGVKTLGTIEWPWSNNTAGATGDLLSSPALGVDADAGPSVPDFLQAPDLDPNFNVEDGEGGISFFEGLGLTEAQWYEVQPELSAQFPDEFLSNGYINNSGQLSTEAQDFIKNRFSL